MGLKNKIDLIPCLINFLFSPLMEQSKMIHYFVIQDHTLLCIDIEKNYTVSHVSKEHLRKQNVIASSSNYNDTLDV